MPATGEPWTELDLRELGPDEFDTREYKASWILAEGGQLNGSFLATISKQVSAFANGAGGRVFVGVDDDGLVDGGVPADLRAGGVRAWLEDIVGGSVDPPLPAFNVFEVRGELPDTRIHPGHAVYVLEIPASDLAPHQALDHRYYLRIAGKSRPMGHVHLQDVLRRTRHPRVDLTSLGPFGEPELDPTDPRGPRALISFRAFLLNRGPSLARHVGGELLVPRPLVNTVARSRMLSYEGVRLTQTPGTLSFFKYHPVPLFPTQEAFFQRMWIAVHAANVDQIEAGAELRWRIYADDAPPVLGSRPLIAHKVVRRAIDWVRRPQRRALPG